MSNTKSQGCILALGDGASPEVFASLVGSIADFNFGSSRSELTGTTLASTTVETEPGLIDNGTIDFNGKFQASDGALVDLWDAVQGGTSHNWRVTFTDSPATVFDVTGWAKDFSISVGADDLVRVSGAIRITSVYTDNLA